MKKRNLAIGVIALALITSLGFAYTQGIEVKRNPDLVFVSHTEYWSNDTFSTIVRLSDFLGSPVDNATCNATIFYPNKTAYITEEAMSSSSIAGNYYYEGETPTITGTYEELVQCTGVWKGRAFDRSVSESFHVNPALNYLRNLSQQMIDTNTSIHTVIGAVNSSLVAELGALNDSMQLKMDSIYGNLSEQINTNTTTILNLIDAVNTTITTQLGDMNTSIQNKLDSVYGNLSDQINANISTVIELLNNFSSENAGNHTLILSYLDDINNTATSTYDYVTGDLTTNIEEINQTTQNIYTYITGTLADDIDNILLGLGAIKDETSYINATVTTIQEDIEGQLNIQIIS